MPNRRSARGWEAHPDFREGSAGPPKGVGDVGRLTGRSGMGQESYPEVWEGSGW